tara:strand:- start:203 stop:580 length:378 start_codon:yes stop_codon:yes gene_type:complete
MQNTYDKILERIDRIEQDYVSSTLASSQRTLKLTNEFIESLTISDVEKETLHEIIKYHRIVIENCVKKLEEKADALNNYRRAHFSWLPLEEQREAIIAVPDQLKIGFNSNELQEFAKFSNSVIEL